jgi:hypothetical protein
VNDHSSCATSAPTPFVHCARRRGLSSLAILLLSSACLDPVAPEELATAEQSSSTTARIISCCDSLRGVAAYHGITAPVSAHVNVCVPDGGVAASYNLRGAKPISIPLAKLGVQQAQLQFFVGFKLEGHDCLTSRELARVPAASAIADITFDGGVLRQCATRGAGCTCPVCPDPVVPE